MIFISSEINWWDGGKWIQGSGECWIWRSISRGGETGTSVNPLAVNVSLFRCKPTNCTVFSREIKCLNWLIQLHGRHDQTLLARKKEKKRGKKENIEFVISVLVTTVADWNGFGPKLLSTNLWFYQISRVCVCARARVQHFVNQHIFQAKTLDHCSNCWLLLQWGFIFGK